MRRALIVLGVVSMSTCAVLAVLWYQAQAPWKQWDVFKRGFIQEDGRVIDHTTEARTVSEGQSYAMFFALVANDREQFDRLLSWTTANLSQGDLTQQLPAWLWGEREDGSWGVIDANSASDADLWIAYSLFEAARLWDAPEYMPIARGLLDLIVRSEIVETQSGDVLLLPAPTGFAQEGGWRVNPSYVPGFQIQYFEQMDPAGPWHRLWQTFMKQSETAFANGYVPDMYWVNTDGSTAVDPEDGSRGSYDAIRVYLWAGMTVGSDGDLLSRLRPFTEKIALAGRPPEYIDTVSGAVSGQAPPSFSAAVIPFLKRLGERELAQRQRDRLDDARVAGAVGVPPYYYDQVLALFGEGWDQGQYRFNHRGQLEPKWESLCCGR